jgi:hypothetical protein
MFLFAPRRVMTPHHFELAEDGRGHCVARDTVGSERTLPHLQGPFAFCAGLGRRRRRLRQRSAGAEPVRRIS